MTGEGFDGNAVGRLLSEAFVPDIAAAGARCDGCGAVDAVGAPRAYVDAPGAVLRCLHCEAVLLRVVADGGAVPGRPTGAALAAVRPVALSSRATPPAGRGRRTRCRRW